MLNGAVRYLMSNRVDSKSLGCWFASTSLECDEMLHRSRLAWCYGDLGIATALIEAGNTLGNLELVEFGKQVLLYSSIRRDTRANYVHDSSVCHGSAGIAQIFRTHGIHLNSPELIDAAMYWEADILNRVVKDDDGKHTLLYYDPEEGGYVKRGGILNGPSGAGLYLLGEDAHLNKLLLLPCL